MAILCVAGSAPGIGKTSVAAFLLAHLAGWHAARVRVADEIPDAHTAGVAEKGWLLVAEPAEMEGDAEADRFLAAGAAGVLTLSAEPRGLDAGLERLLARLPADANLLVEGNAFLWARDADLAVMVVGPGPSGKGLPPVRPATRDLFHKIHVWAWNTRGQPTREGFFDFPPALGLRMGGRSLNTRADFHHVDPSRPDHEGNAPFLESVERRVGGPWWRRESDEFLRRIGFDV